MKVNNIPTLIPNPKQDSPVAALGYVPSERQLYVDYRGSGIYVYYDVSPDMHLLMFQSDSWGRFATRILRTSYTYEKISDGTENG